MSHQPNTASEKPPIVRLGPIRWLYQNLFNSIPNAIITVLLILFIYFIIKSLFGWVFHEARWEVIPTNIKLLLIGIYPEESLWRVWTMLAVIVSFVGFSTGLHKGLIRQVAVLIGVASVLLAPFTGFQTLLLTVAIALGFGLGTTALRTPKLGRRLEIAFWLISFPLTILVLIGYGDESSLLPLRTGWQYWGFIINILAAVLGIALSLPIGIFLALGRKSQLPAIRIVCTLYIELIRGVPLVTLLFMASNVLPLFVPGEFRPDIVLRAMVTITAFSAAYMAENVRGGLQAIPTGQYEASIAVGLNHIYTTAFIIMPQALRAVIPAIVGQFISLFKDTSLFSFLAVLEILAMARSIYDGNVEWRGTSIELYVFVAGLFLVLNYGLSIVSRRIEKNLGVGEY